MTRRCFHNGPYEAAELSRDGGDGDMEMFLVAQVIEPPREAMLSLECNGYHLGVLPLSSAIRMRSAPAL
jgi:hypothetical protein